MFGKVKGILKVSEASVIVKQALRALPLPPVDPDALATRLVAISYNSKPELFDGKLGKPPRPITTAAVSLAGGLTLDECNTEVRQCVFLALGNVLLDASANGHRYGLSPIDLRLLQLSEAAYLKHEEKTRDATSAIVGGLGR
jgi:hypothetical protein